MGFGKQWIPICGVPGQDTFVRKSNVMLTPATEPALSMGRELQQAYLPAANILPNFPQSTSVRRLVRPRQD